MKAVICFLERLYCSVVTKEIREECIQGHRPLPSTLCGKSLSVIVQHARLDTFPVFQREK